MLILSLSSVLYYRKRIQTLRGRSYRVPADEARRQRCETSPEGFHSPCLTLGVRGITRALPVRCCLTRGIPDGRDVRACPSEAVAECLKKSARDQREEGRTPLQITEIEPMAIAEPGGRRYVVLRVTTDEGQTGYGEAPPSGDLQETVARLNKELTALHGRDPGQMLRIDRELLEAGASHGARAAANVALMDILARSVRAPLYELLGEPTRNKARAMAVVEGEPTGALSEAVLRAKQAGHRAFSVPLHLPSGRERGRAFYRTSAE